jgi:hypothetical protein
MISQEVIEVDDSSGNGSDQELHAQSKMITPQFTRSSENNRKQAIKRKRIIDSDSDLDDIHEDDRLAPSITSELQTIIGKSSLRF